MAKQYHAVALTHWGMHVHNTGRMGRECATDHQCTCMRRQSRPTAAQEVPAGLNDTGLPVAKQAC